MKQRIMLLSIGLFCLSIAKVSAQIIDIGLFKVSTGSNKLEVRVRPTVDVINGSYSGGLFTIKTPSSSGVSSISVISSPYNYSAGVASTPTVGAGVGNTYFRFSFVNTNQASSNYYVNWMAGQEYVIATLEITGSNGGLFEVANDAFTSSILNNASYYQEVNDIPNENIIYASVSVILPVTLLNFDAKKIGRTTELAWKTSSERNSSYFIVERSNGGDFTAIGTVKAANFPTGSDYFFVDETPLSGINYYRLKMEDNDKKFKYSKVISVDFGDKLTAKTYPNPFDRNLTVEVDIAANIRGNIEVDVVDFGGKVVFSKQVLGEGRKTTFSVPTDNLAAGNYIIRMKNGKDTWQQKITKQ
jgi:hypothetical protein